MWYFRNKFKSVNHKNKQKKFLIDKLIDKIIELCIDTDYNIRVFIIGCEIGISMVCGEIVVNFLKNYPKDLYLYNILPFKNREN